MTANRKHRRARRAGRPARRVRCCGRGARDICDGRCGTYAQLFSELPMPFSRIGAAVFLPV
jgi:hypothetical protein